MTALALRQTGDAFAEDKLIIEAQQRIIELDPDAPRTMRTDPTRLQQILLNLVGNGVKFTDRGEVRTRIAVLAREVDWLFVRFEVSDTGIGVAPEDLGRLFRPFEQVDGMLQLLIPALSRFGAAELPVMLSRCSFFCQRLVR